MTSGNWADKTHPQYDVMEADWIKFRAVAESGHDFVEAYTEQMSTRETAADFTARKAVSYCPAHAKAAVLDVKNAIYQRMVDIQRLEGPDSYKAAVGRAVDREGNTMNGFIGRRVIFELLTLGKMGVYVDRAPLPEGASLAETRLIQPYLYPYAAEDILNWAYDEDNILTALLLKDTIYTTDEDTGLIDDEEERYRYLRRTKAGVEYQVFDADDELTDQGIIQLTHIPFVIFELSQSLLTDIADYQIALMNLASADMSYALKSNFPFYTEQVNPALEGQYMRPATEEADGTADNAAVAGHKSLEVGAMHGRKYGLGLDRPGFIHPSGEPLKLSMEKQDKLKTDIRQLINLNLETLEPRRASAESKQEDKATKEEGLSYIGLELEYGERQIAYHWAEYEQATPAEIKYPTNYSLKSEADRRAEGKELGEFVKIVPSKTYQKAVLKEVAAVTIGHKIPDQALEDIKDEIDEQDVVVYDAKTLVEDHKEGIVTADTAAKLRGYPDGEADRAAKEHAERLARIIAAQTPNEGNERPASRGVADASPEPVAEAREEKQA